MTHAGASPPPSLAPDQTVAETPPVPGRDAKRAQTTSNGEGAARPDRRRVREGPSRARLWFALHGWLALPIWVFLFFVCITGTISVVSHEIAWLVDPRVRAANPAGREPLGFDQLVAAVREELPEATFFSAQHREPYLAAYVAVGLPNTSYATAYVNPYDARLQGVHEGLTFPDFMRELHGWLLLPWRSGTSIGYYLVSAMSLVLLGLLVTGLVVHKRFWRSFYRPRIRADRGGRVWWGDLHRLVGPWSAWFIASVSLTGLWFLTQGILWDAGVPFESLPPAIAREQVPTVPHGEPPPPAINLDDVVAAAHGTIPDLDVRWIIFPENALGPISVYGKERFPLIGDFATHAHVHPYTGAVTDSRRLRELTAVQLVDHMADPLHYGNFAGLWSKLVWVLFGLGLSGLVLSGAMVWTKRTTKTTTARRRAPVLPVPAAR